MQPGLGEAVRAPPCSPQAPDTPLLPSRAGRHQLPHGREVRAGNFGVLQGVGRDVVQQAEPTSPTSLPPRQAGKGVAWTQHPRLDLLRSPPGTGQPC